MRTTQLRSFDAVATTGGFTAAARALGVRIVAENELLGGPRLVMLDIRDPATTLEERSICRTTERETALCRAVFDAARRLDASQPQPWCRPRTSSC